MMEARTEEIRMEDIRIAGRIRKEEGDLEGLASSVKERGLINPVTVMEMSGGGYLLLAGARRISACRSLGWERIRATVVPAVDAEEQLRIEVAENEERKEFTVEERLNFAAQISEIEKEKALERKSFYGKVGRERQLGGEPCSEEDGDTPNCAYPQKGESRDFVAKKAGFSSREQMRKAQTVADNRPDLLDKIDSGELSVHAAYKLATADSEAPTPSVPRPVFKDTLPGVSGDTEAATDTSQDFVPAMPGPAEEAIYGETVPTVGMTQDEGRYGGIPKQPGEVLMARLTPEEKRKAREIEALMVREQEFTIDTEIPEMFRPADYDTHERLMAEPMYAQLYEHDRKLQGVANLIRGELVTKCENYEKRIRSYEENIQAMHRQIEILQAQLAQKNTETDFTESEGEDL